MHAQRELTVISSKREPCLVFNLRQEGHVRPEKKSSHHVFRPIFDPRPIRRKSAPSCAWREKVTLCIAAACRDRRRPRVVIATDWKVGIQTATAEIQDKLYWIDDNTPVLIAGTISRAIELKDTYQNYFARLSKKEPPLKASDLPDVMKRPLGIYKHKLANEYVSLRLGLTYKQFLEAAGKKQVPEAVSTEIFSEISRISLQCWLIVVVFVKKEPYIYKIDDEGTLHSCDNFAAIGSGSTIAEGILYQREQESSMALGRTVYHVFEAMKLGSIATDVGEEHTINVLHPPGDKRKDVAVDALTEKAKLFLKRKFDKLGPKPFSNMPLPDGFFEQDF